MRRVNLIREIDNVRNSLRPEEKKLEKRRDRRRRIIGATLIVAGLGWYLYEGPGWEEKPEELLRKIAEERGVNMTPTREPSGVADLMATESTPPPATEVATGWRIRYGLCNIEESCVKLVAELKPKGIEAELIRGGEVHPAWQVVMGPWPTPTQAEEVLARLGAEGVEATLTRATGQSWLTAGPVADVDTAQKLSATGAKVGAPTRIEEAPSTETVYKVYDTTRYPDREKGEAACRERKKEGVDCILEERPL